MKYNLGVKIVSYLSNSILFGVVWLSVAKFCSVMNIIRRHIDNMKLLLVCILLLSHPLIFIFYQYMVVFLFNIVICVFLLKESIYSYCCLCIIIVRPCILIVVYVFLLLSMYVYSYCSSMYS
jgi:hypothetical protein